MGTYSKIYSKTTGALWRKGTNRYDQWPAGLIHLWNATSPTSRLVGPLPVYSAASQQPDANGDLVDWPNYIAGKGVVVHPAYSTIAFSSAAVNTTASTVVDTTIGFTPVTSVKETSENVVHAYNTYNAATSGVKYTFSVFVKYDGRQFAQIAGGSLAFGSPVYANFDIVNGTVTRTVSCTAGIENYGNGWFLLHATFLAIASATAYFTFAGLLSDVAARIPAYIGDPDKGYFITGRSVVASSYQLPYVVAGTAVASTAATSAGNGLAIPMDSRMTAALGGIFTAAAIVNMRASSAEVTADTNILAVNNNVTGGIYMAASGILKAFDGTNTATVTVTDGWERDDEILIVWWINGAGINQQIGYKKKVDSTITWGAAASYDGSVNPGTHLRYGYTIDKPIGLIHSHLWNKSVATDAEILALIERYVDPGYLYIYTLDSDGAFILDSDGAEVYEDA